MIKSEHLNAETTEIVSQLVERAKTGNQQAIFRLYKMHVQAMYNTCIRIVVNQFDAEDILQESFVTAFGRLDSYRGESTFSTWLRRIVINKSLNHLKKKKLSFIDVGEATFTDECSNEEDFPEIPLDVVHGAIKNLPERARVVLTLYLLEGYLHKDIAEMLGISESTSKSQYQRAKAILREKILETIRMNDNTSKLLQ